MNDTTEIFVSLLGEQVEVRRPVRAQHLHDDVFEIAAQAYDREIETWEFEPGEAVVCDLIESSDGPILAAIRGAE
jgi:hypothetical protein